MRFPEFLRATTLCSAASATLLAVLTLAGVHGTGDTSVGYIGIGWWIVSAGVGSWIGRPRATSPQISTLLADARTQMSLPELHPSRVMINRLWPLLVLTIIAGAPSFVRPQVPAVAAGFTIIWSFAWRHQSAAVTAIEERDGARFYVERTSPLRAMKLVRTPGFRATRMELAGTTSGSGTPGGTGPISVIRRRLSR